jgi:hypothetical protein
MTLTLRTDYGCTEAVIDENCGFDKFYKVADVLHDKFNIHFTNKIDDSDTSYWILHSRATSSRFITISTMAFLFSQGKLRMPLKKKMKLC